MKRIGVLFAGVALAIAGLVCAADTQPASQPAAPACCGTPCKNMGEGCCKADDKGNVTCSMGGSCCVQSSTTPAGDKSADRAKG